MEFHEVIAAIDRAIKKDVPDDYSGHLSVTVDDGKDYIIVLEGWIQRNDYGDIDRVEVEEMFLQFPDYVCVFERKELIKIENYYDDRRKCS